MVRAWALVMLFVGSAASAWRTVVSVVSERGESVGGVSCIVCR